MIALQTPTMYDVMTPTATANVSANGSDLPASIYVMESLTHWGVDANGKSSNSKALHTCSICLSGHDDDDDEACDTNQVESDSQNTCSCNHHQHQEEEDAKVIMMTQLPCGHTYHTGCIAMWFKKHCTCPECRYEVPTDDFFYELDRAERMKSYLGSKKQIEIKQQTTKHILSIEKEQPEGILTAKDGSELKILKQLDYETSTTPKSLWR